MAVTTRTHPNEDVQEFRTKSTGAPTPDTPAFPSWTIRRDAIVQGLMARG